MRYVNLVFVSFFLPSVAHSAVTINEVAWMGNSDSANYEWIELHNDGGEVSLEGWTLSDGEGLNIDLVGTILSGEYAVLERTSEASAPGTAFQIYTGALRNTGATLSLRRSDSGLEDQVGGGENWENIGGDNTTKETAQYTPSGWITAEATPGSANVTFQVNDSEAEEKEKENVTVVKSKSSGTPILLELPGNILQLEIDAPKRVFVNQVVKFDVEPGQVGDTIEDSLQYQWNFGDLHTSTEKSPKHIFAYPGTYVVSVRAGYATQDSTATHEITVLPVDISLTKNQEGDIQINNDSPYAVDLSSYRLRAGVPIDLPDNTWLLSRQTITVPHSMVDASSNTLIALYDNYGELLTSVLPDRLKVSERGSLVTQEFVPRAEGRISAAEDNVFNFVSQAEAAEDESPAPVEKEKVTFSQPSDTNSGTQTPWAIIALLALLSIGCVVVLVQPLGRNRSLDSHE